ncbi:putative u2 small nuclear ribonucleoprotein b protein [Eutypa lata UCREL1]|uniref:Putative u2 small nuclear ribonucleoprotein b protein n=1 Tax=Eutypa lata (strain UCR-EL1) TaxID=1287681 RepID=M7SSG6_EUTLA|nr:putative u2 small nuclear ribonucleoprotein b protein [Eutypa lata UCREL1]
MRGQAHVVFRDVQAATQAMRALEGFEFLGRELRIQYAKSKSDMIAKLDGTYKLPGSAAANVEMTETQHSIFNAPPPSSSAAGAPSTTAAAPPPHGLPSRPSQSTDQAMTEAKSPDNRGQKRPRDEEEESDEDVAMEEDSDED